MEKKIKLSDVIKMVERMSTIESSKIFKLEKYINIKLPPRNLSGEQVKEKLLTKLKAMEGK
jgi:hypothetical protein